MPGPFAALSLQQSSDIHRDGLCGQWPDTDFWGLSTGLQLQPALPAPASRNSKAASAGPSVLVQPQQLRAGGTARAAGTLRQPVPAASARLSRQLSPRGQQRRSPGCASPAAAPHRDLLLCPCGNTDNKVYSNRSGGGTVTCSEPPMRHGPEFCLSS